MPKSRDGRDGFTIIEVVLFIAISGFLIVGLMVGTSATVARQRYNDSVQDLAEFFRREFSAVVNPENVRSDPIDDAMCLNKTNDGSSSVSGTSEDIEGPNRGRSDCLIYGRLITIGEINDGQQIFSYDVIGRELSNDDIVEATTLNLALKAAEINVLVRKNLQAPDPSACPYQPARMHQYTPQWLATVEGTAANRPHLRVSILIVRSPVNGSIHTLVYDNAIKVQDAIGPACTTGTASSLLDPDTIASFAFAELDLCVGSDDIFALDGQRRNVRIGRDGHNSSAVAITDQDSEDNPCQ